MRPLRHPMHCCRHPLCRRNCESVDLACMHACMLSSGGVWSQVQDLHAMSPRAFLEVAGGVLHGLSYQQARNNTARVGQVRRERMGLHHHTFSYALRRSPSE